MNAETIAALERAALYAEQRRNSLLSDMEGLATEEAIELGRFALMHGKDAALIRAHIETLRNGGERAQLDKWLRGDEAFQITGSVFTEDLADAIAAGAHLK